MFATAPTSWAETVDFSTITGATNLRTGGTYVQSFGAAPTLVSVTTSGSFGGANNTNGATGVPSPALTITGSAPPANTAQMINSVINATADDESNWQTTTFTFTEPAYNVSVVVGDIDGGANVTSGTAQFNDIVEFRGLPISATSTAAASFTTLPSSGTPAVAGNVTWTVGTGRASANGIFCANTGAGSTNCNITVTFVGPVRSVSVRHIAGIHNSTNDPSEQYVKIASVTFTRSPLLTVNKQALNGTGSFPLAVGNILTTATNPWSAASGSESLNVATVGATATGTQRILFATSTATVVTETVPAGWRIDGSTMSCTDSNAGVSGNSPATFTAAVTGSLITIDSNNIRAGAIIACTVINNTRPQVTLRKIANGVVGAFGFSGTNGLVTQTLTPTATGLAGMVTGKASVLTAAGTVITETFPTPNLGWEIEGVSCTGMGVGGTVSFTGNQITLNAAATPNGADLVCTVTNRRLPLVSVQKVTTGGVGGPFSFADTNLTGTFNPITTTAPPGTPTPSPGQKLVAALGLPATITESFGSGWVTTGIVCTDQTTSTTAFSATSGSAANIPGSATVVGADINCVFTNAVPAPAVSVTKNWSFATPSGDVNGNGLADVGDQIVYEYLVTNSGNVTLTNVVVDDIHEGAALPTSPARVVTNETKISDGPGGTSTDSGINGLWEILTRGSVIRFRYNHTVNLTEFNAG